MNFQIKPSNVERSITDVKMKKFTFVWEIKNFKFYDFENENALFSPKFTTGDSKNHTWDIKISSNKEYLSLLLRLHNSNGPEINATLVILISGQKNNQDVSKEVSFLVKHGQTEKRNFPNFVKTDHLLDEKNGLLINGTLTIKCQFYFQDDILNCSPINGNLLSGSTMSYDMESLFKNNKLSDVTIIIGHEEFQAHKCILAARSRVFSAMFEHEMLEKKESVIRIDDIDPKVMKEVLRFIYCGKIKNEKPATDLLAAANKYELEELKNICEDKLLDSVNGQNIGETLVFADRYKAEKLKKHALNFILTHAKDINLEKFKSDVESHSPLLIDLVNQLNS